MINEYLKILEADAMANPKVSVGMLVTVRDETGNKIAIGRVLDVYWVQQASQYAVRLELVDDGDRPPEEIKILDNYVDQVTYSRHHMSAWLNQRNRK